MASTTIMTVQLIVLLQPGSPSIDFSLRQQLGEELNKYSCFHSDPIVCFMFISCSPCNHVEFMRH